MDKSSFSLISTGPTSSLMPSPFLCLHKAIPIQSKYDFPLDTSEEIILSSFNAAALQHLFAHLSKFEVAPVIISFSFALVNATYKILISSDNVSNLVFCFIASLAKVL